MLKVLLLSAMVFAAREQGAHVHGTAHVSIGFDGKKGKITMESPADSLFGFEHEAKSKKDRQKKDEALKKLEEKISEMIVFDPSLQCEIKKEIFEVNQQRNHSDVDAEFAVTCQGPVAGTSVSFNFQKVFPRFKKVQVDVIADQVQKSLEVKKNGESLDLK